LIRFDLADTIAAIASPPGPSPRGLLRIAGPDAWPVAARMIGLEAEALRSGLTIGSIRLPDVLTPLPSRVFLGRGPRTYTGQDSAEVHTLGAPPLLRLVLALALQHGARLAEPGEFTLRAFLTGKIDLTRAEAVLGVIEAATPAQLAIATGQLAGGLASQVLELRDRLLDQLTMVEAALDFVDEPDVLAIDPIELARAIESGRDLVADLARRMTARDRANDRPRVALSGRPNAGKSRLFNALARDDRAIVTSMPGTTRDPLVAAIDCDGLVIDLIDTAGLDDAPGPIDQAARTARAVQLSAADLVLDCAPCDEPYQRPASVPDHVPVLRVATKADLGDAPRGFLATSAATSAGLAELRRAIADTLRERPSDGGDLVGTTAARCRQAMIDTADALDRSSLALKDLAPPELVAVDLREAVDGLGQVVGAVATEDMLDRIFRRFCIGK
jgi:tRNA modification GTPase